MMDWLGKMLQLPEAFLAGNAGEGGGVIQVRQGGAESPAFWDAWLSQRDHSCRWTKETLVLLVASSPFSWKTSRDELL